MDIDNNSSLQVIWQHVVEIVKQNVSAVMFNLWVAQIKPFKMTYNPDTVIFLIDTQFRKDLLVNKFEKPFKDAFEMVLGFPVAIDFIVENTAKAKSDESNDKEQKEDMEKKSAVYNDNLIGSERYTFDNFIVGNSNNLAYTVSLGVANRPGEIHNPLLIHGRSGLGKTHLMGAICNKLKKDNPDMVVMYTTGEEFMNDMLDSLAKKNTKAFHDKYRNVDALLMDDIQVIQKGSATQEEFFHTFDALYRAGKQIVLTSDVPAKEMVILEDRIKTRLESGMFADIKTPDIDTRKAIILRKCQQLDITLPDSINSYIATKVKNNIRQLEGTVKKIAVIQTTYGKAITMQQVEEIINDITTDNQPTSVMVEKIIEEVSKEFELQPSVVKSNSRESDVVLARDVCIYVIKEVTNLTHVQIGAFFNNRNHSSINHALKGVNAKMDRTPKAKAIAIKAIGDFQPRE